MASTSSNKKLLICDVLKSIGEGMANVEVSNTIMKAHIMGVITGIKQYHQRTIFTVDDGTGALDCILWCNEPASLGKIFDLQKDVKSGITPLTFDMKNFALSLLKKADTSSIGEEGQYTHGDVMSCLGNIKIFRGKPQLVIQHHYKGSDVNAESMWILDVLVTKQYYC